MTTAYFDLNANFTTEDLTCNDVHLGLNKTIYGDTSLNLDCAVINLGKSGQTVNIVGDLNKISTTDLQIKDQLITINKGGNNNSSKLSGFEIDNIEDSGKVGYFKSDVNGNQFQLKAPQNSYYLSTGILTQNEEVAFKSQIPSGNLLTDQSTLERTKLSPGTNVGYILANDNSGNLSEQQYVRKAQGGLEQDVSQLTVSGNDQKFLQYDDTSGLFQMASVQTDIADNSLALNKVSNGTAWKFLQFNNSGVLSESNALEYVFGSQILRCPQNFEISGNYNMFDMQDRYFLGTYNSSTINDSNWHDMLSFLNDLGQTSTVRFQFTFKLQDMTKSAYLEGVVKIHTASQAGSYPTFSDIYQNFKICDTGLENVAVQFVRDMGFQRTQYWKCQVKGLTSNSGNYIGRIEILRN